MTKMLNLSRINTYQPCFIVKNITYISASFCLDFSVTLFMTESVTFNLSKNRKKSTM